MSDTNLSEAPSAPVTEAVVASTPNPTPDDTMAAVFDKHYPTERVGRGDDGKFVSKNPAEGAVEAEPATEITTEPVAAEVETPKASIKPRPQSWSADLDDWWAQLPPERQDFLSKRESESHQKITQLGEKATVAEKYASVLDRYKHVIDGPPDREIEGLLATKAAFRMDPEGTFRQLAQQLGIDLSRFAPRQDGEQPAENDHYRSLMQRLEQSERRQAELMQRLSARDQQDQQSKEQSLEALVNDFKQGKDHWPEIEAEIYNQIIAIKTANPNMEPKAILEKAEKNAIKLNDEVSNKLTKAQRDKEAADKAAAEKKKAEDAKRLASLNTKSSTGTNPKPAKNIDAELEDIYDKIAARG